MANDHGGTTRVEHERHRQQLDEFLADANQDVARMRGMESELGGGDAAAWGRLETLAHNLAARSQILKLGVLNACVRELQQFVDDRRKGAPLDAFFLQCVNSAIETVALEIESLRRS
jgi:hypothetical protein